MPAYKLYMYQLFRAQTDSAQYLEEDSYFSNKEYTETESSSLSIPHTGAKSKLL